MYCTANWPSLSSWKRKSKIVIKEERILNPLFLLPHIPSLDYVSIHKCLQFQLSFRWSRLFPCRGARCASLWPKVAMQRQYGVNIELQPVTIEIYFIVRLSFWRITAQTYNLVILEPMYLLRVTSKRHGSRLLQKSRRGNYEVSGSSFYHRENSLYQRMVSSWI